MLSNLIVPVAVWIMLFAPSVPAEAQQPKKPYRIGFLSAASASSAARATKTFREGLAQLGYLDGQNIIIEYRFSEGQLDRLNELAQELARHKVDIIVAAGGATPVRAAKRATETIPIVMTNSADPVGSGLVTSLARPGGNITGLSTLSLELGGKRLEILSEMLHKLRRVAILGNPRETPSYDRQMKEINVAAQALGVQLQPVDVRGPDDMERAFAAVANADTEALIMLVDPVFTNIRAQVAQLAIKSRLPVVYTQREYVDAGGLISYGTNPEDLYRRAATYVDKILKGAKPADLPVEQPIKFELVINLKTAKQIGLAIPANVLARADKVIK